MVDLDTTVLGDLTPTSIARHKDGFVITTARGSTYVYNPSTTSLNIINTPTPALRALRTNNTVRVQLTGDMVLDDRTLYLSARAVARDKHTKWVLTGTKLWYWNGEAWHPHEEKNPVVSLYEGQDSVLACVAAGVSLETQWLIRLRFVPTEWRQRRCIAWDDRRSWWKNGQVKKVCVGKYGQVKEVVDSQGLWVLDQQGLWREKTLVHPEAEGFGKMGRSWVVCGPVVLPLDVPNEETVGWGDILVPDESAITHHILEWNTVPDGLRPIIDRGREYRLWPKFAGQPFVSRFGPSSTVREEEMGEAIGLPHQPREAGWEIMCCPPNMEIDEWIESIKADLSVDDPDIAAEYILAGVAGGDRHTWQVALTYLGAEHLSPRIYVKGLQLESGEVVHACEAHMPYEVRKQAVQEMVTEKYIPHDSMERIMNLYGVRPTVRSTILALRNDLFSFELQYDALPVAHQPMVRWVAARVLRWDVIGMTPWELHALEPQRHVSWDTEVEAMYDEVVDCARFAKPRAAPGPPEHSWRDDMEKARRDMLGYDE